MAVYCKEHGQKAVPNTCRVCYRSEQWEGNKPMLVKELFTPRIARDLETIRVDVDDVLPDVVSGNGLFLTGPPGTGKTIFACSVVLDAIKYRWLYKEGPTNCLFTTAISLINRIQQAIRESVVGRVDATSISDLEMIEEYCSTGLLILDDFGAERYNEWSAQIIQHIMNVRYEELRTTIITSNYGLREISERVDGRLASRLCTMCRVLVFGGDDYRLENLQVDKIK